MSDRDELIAKARELSAAATPGPWNWANWGDVGDPDDVLEANRPAKDDADRRVWGETVSIKIAKDEDHDLSEADRSFLAESRTLLPALADLAESEGRRADESEAWIAEAQPLIDMLREYQASQGAPMYQAMMQRMLATTIVPGSIKLKGQQP